MRWLSRHLPITRGFEGGKFFVMKDGIRFATPLLVVLAMVETTDVVFAVDSVPAVLAITRNTFIVFTSNVFALLGLRAMYFALASLLRLFHYLHYGLALILVFIGSKILFADLVLRAFGYHLSTAVELGVVGLLLAGSVGLSLLRPKAEA